MKTDLYTKTMLTLIVLLLGVLSFDKVYDSFIRDADASTTNAWKCETWTSRFINGPNFNLYLAQMGIQQIEMAEDKAGGGILICMR